jgi:hypothetical protein
MRRAIKDAIVEMTTPMPAAYRFQLQNIFKKNFRPAFNDPA